MVHKITTKQVKYLVEDLNEVSPDWRLFAGQLGVEDSKLRMIQDNNAGKSNFVLLCFSDALHCWVESSDNPTYEDMAKVLRGNTVENVPLAKKIEEKYLHNLKRQQNVMPPQPLPSGAATGTETADDGQAKADTVTITGKSDKQKKRVCTSLVFLLACIIAAIIVKGFVRMFDEPSSNQPDDPPSISKQMLSMCMELENIKLASQGNINIEHNLPYLPGKVFGRGNDLLRLTHLVLNHTSSGVNAVVIYGPPAVGKSTLAIHLGYELMKLGVNARYIDVQESSIFRDLNEVYVGSGNVDQVSKPDDLPKASLETQLGKRSSDISIAAESDAVSAEERSLLTWAKNLQKEYLLILDNYDINLHKEFLLKIKKASPRLRIAITRQQQAKLMAYKPFPLSFLDTETAIELLRHESSNKNLSDADCRKISEAVDKSPLALKIAAYILSEDTPIIEDFLDSLKSNPIHVLNEDVGLPENSTLLAVLTSAYNRLSYNTKLCGHYISNFPGSFASEGGEQVLEKCMDGIYSRGECLKELAERSLLESYTLANQNRHRLHRLVREFFKYKGTFEVRIARTVADTSIFNHSYIDYYSATFAQILYNCSEYCMH